ncbi:MAG: yhjD [Humibacillus sp.]|nr:yhjD [Humibacillus sp.]
MASVKERLDRAREHHPALDHVLRMNAHYGEAHGGQQAGAVTYFAFLSFFPVLALAFFAVGIIAGVYPEARLDVTKAIDSVFTGLVGPGDGQISLDEVQSFSGLAGLVGLLGVLYAGLGWVSALREALTEVFETPRREQPSFVKGKLRDLVALVVIGLVLVVAVAVAGFVSGFSTSVLDLVGLGSELSWLVKVVVALLGLGANAVLFFTLFRMLAEPQAPPRSLWSGALLGAVGFEVLKQLSGLLLGTTRGQPAFQAFDIALVLLVWINYFSRLVLYAASWAHTSRAAIAMRGTEPADPVQGPRTPDLSTLPPTGARAAWTRPFAAGSAVTLAAVALLRRRTS